MDNLIELATFNDDKFGMVTQFIDNQYTIVFMKKTDNGYIPITPEENNKLKSKYLGGE